MSHQKPNPHKQALAALTPPPEFRIPPRDPEIYLSTSPWQIMDYDYELAQKSLLVEQCFIREGLLGCLEEHKAECNPRKSQAPVSIAQRASAGFSRRVTCLRKRWKRVAATSHKSFRRSYREDYIKQDQSPGLFAHATHTLTTLLKNRRTFLALFAAFAIASILLLGLLSEDTYVSFQKAIDETAAGLETGDIGRGAKAGLLLVSSFTSGGLSQTMSETQRVLTIFVFLAVWLTTIFILRGILSDNKPKMRDALYSALSPLVSTLLVFVMIFIHLIPIFLVIIAYSSASATDFLATPFYAFIFWLLACALTLLSCYLLSSSLMALVVVTVPSTRPFAALNLASDLMAGRRIKFIIRILFLLFLALLALVAIVFPIIVFDLWLKSAFPFFVGWPIVPVVLLLFTTFFFIYATAYIYLYYRRLIDK
jgi:hypothetical protein